MTSLEECFGYCPFTGSIFRVSSNGRGSKTIKGEIINSLDDQGYVRFQHNGKKQRGHRVAHYVMTGEWPLGVIDHINSNKSDNRWDNLREISHADNVKVGRRHNKLKLKHI